MLVSLGLELKRVDPRQNDRFDQVLLVVSGTLKVLGQGASSNSGLVGGLVLRRSSTGSTMPRPIRTAHMRLTWTLAK